MIDKNDIVFAPYEFSSEEISNMANERISAWHVSSDICRDMICDIYSISEIIANAKEYMNRNDNVLYTDIKPAISEDFSELDILGYFPFNDKKWHCIYSFELSKLYASEIYLDNYLRRFFNSNSDLCNKIVSLQFINKDNLIDYTSNFIDRARYIISKFISKLNMYHPKEITAIDRIMKNIMERINSYVDKRYKFDLKYSIEYNSNDIYYTINDEFKVSLNLK